MLKIKGHNIEEPDIRNSFGRRAIQIKNKIIQILKPLGVHRDSITVKLELITQKNAPAIVSWYFDGRNLKYSYSLMPRFIDNLYIIDKVLELEVERLLSDEITTNQFVHEFSEDDNLSEQRALARKTFDVSTEEKDFEVISKKYKALAKKYHPDMSGGDNLMFQKINAAHKLLKKELM